MPDDRRPDGPNSKVRRTRLGARPSAPDRAPPGPRMPRGPRPPDPRREQREQREPRTLPILHQDKWIVAINKPVGLPVIGHDEEASVLSIIRQQIRVRRRDQGPWTLHQLDQYASGITLLALTPTARENIMRSRRFERFYLVLVEGPPAAESAPENGTVSTEQKGRDTGVVRQLVTHYQRLAVRDGRALLRLRPRTDAPGQIERHLRQIGAVPVIGPKGFVGLHLAEVTFSHPDSSERMRLSCPAPAWMYDAVGLPAPQSDTPETTEGWDEVADWYAGMLGSSRSDLHTDLVHPGVDRLLTLTPGQRLLDVACGEGTLAARFDPRDVAVVGIDASPRLIELAQQRHLKHAHFELGDARTLERLSLEPFDAASCVLALMNINPLEPVMRGIASALKPGGRFVAVVLHPAFRTPRRSSWVWVGATPESQQQHRRVDAYLSIEPIEIVMNPGAVASGEPPITTVTYARPLQSYIRAITSAGLLIDSIEEWSSPRQSEPGPRAQEENRARREFPMFLAIRAIKPAQGLGIAITDPAS